MNHATGSFDNPFATRWVSPGKLPYLFPSGESIAFLLERFYENQCRGSIVGPHGCGKSTLLATLLPHFRRESAAVEMVVLRADERRLPRNVSRIWRREPSRSKKDLLVIDGWEQLRVWTRLRVSRRCRQSGCGLLVTCHRPLQLPVLTHVASSLATARTLVARLTRQWDIDVPADIIEASFQSHRGNCREMLFDLYDWFEQSKRNHSNKR